MTSTIPKRQVKNVGIGVKKGIGTLIKICNKKMNTEVIGPTKENYKIKNFTPVIKIKKSLDNYKDH